MIANTLYVRVVPQDRDRGYMLLAGFDSKVVQSTCARYTTLSAVTRESLNEVIDTMRVQFNAAEVRDCTAPNIVRQLKKMFGEPL
jgi:hypothetical protein